MKKTGIAKMQGVAYPYGSVAEMVDKEREKYIVPLSTKLTYHGEQLRPTQFDDHGNPQIGGLAHLILVWKTRQLARDGVIKSEYDMEVEYSYDVVSEKEVYIPMGLRLPNPEICPVCGKHIFASDLDGDDEKTESLGGGLTASWSEPRVETIRPYNTVAHANCAKEFYRLKMIDEITERTQLAFNCYDIDKENRFEWGKGENQMWYELIPNEYCSRDCCAHRPWFMFHTPLGDIKIGWRKRVINITFMENFREFDLMELFADEDVTKNVDSGRRTIHAWGLEKMYEYLRRVQQTVLPNKK